MKKTICAMSLVLTSTVMAGECKWSTPTSQNQAVKEWASKGLFDSAPVAFDYGDCARYSIYIDTNQFNGEKTLIVERKAELKDECTNPGSGVTLLRAAVTSGQKLEVNDFPYARTSGGIVFHINCL